MFELTKCATETFASAAAAASVRGRSPDGSGVIRLPNLSWTGAFGKATVYDDVTFLTPIACRPKKPILTHACLGTLAVSPCLYSQIQRSNDAS